MLQLWLLLLLLLHHRHQRAHGHPLASHRIPLSLRGIDMCSFRVQKHKSPAYLKSVFQFEFHTTSALPHTWPC